MGLGGAGSLWWCSGVVLLRVDEGGVVFFLGLGEFIFVGCHMVFVGQTVDSEGSFFGEPLQPATSRLHGAEVGGEPGGRVGVGNSPSSEGGQRDQT